MGVIFYCAASRLLEQMEGRNGFSLTHFGKICVVESWDPISCVPDSEMLVKNVGAFSMGRRSVQLLGLKTSLCVAGQLRM